VPRRNYSTSSRKRTINRHEIISIVFPRDNKDAEESLVFSLDATVKSRCKRSSAETKNGNTSFDVLCET
jgi:hypothetical protein